MQSTIDSKNLQNVPLRSLIIPVYKNEENIPDLLAVLCDLHCKLDKGFEVIFVVDGSPDYSFTLLQESLSNKPFPSQLILHSRNFGAFAAIRSGLEKAKGRHIAVMAADLQEPPELITKIFELLQNDECDIAFGQRIGRQDSLLYSIFSNLFWRIYRKFVISGIPKGGVDVFGCNEKVLLAVLQFREHNSSLLAQLFWVGYRRSFVPYKRLKRTKGKSSWSFRRRFQYMLDSIFSFSDLPVLIILYVGSVGIGLSFLISILILIFWLFGAIEVKGYTPLMLSMFFFGSVNLTVQGIIACYLWRALENTKQRPLTLIAEVRTFKC